METLSSTSAENHSPSATASAARCRRGFLLGLSLGCLLAVSASFVTWALARGLPQPTARTDGTGKVGAAPLIPTLCNTLGTNSESIGVLVEVDGAPYAMILDTGSSNFNLASTACGAKCDVQPLWPWEDQHGHSMEPTYELTFGTGGLDLKQVTADLSLGSVKVAGGEFSAIVDQRAGTDGFNFFPPQSDPICYNSYAGVLGLAYRGQDAGPARGDQRGKTTNGTTDTLLDQLVAKAGMPNAFAIEVCQRYPLPCGPRQDLTTWTPSRTCDSKLTIGNLYLGGYRSSSLAGEMRYTPISDEIHYDVILLGIEVCGETVSGATCMNISFPDKIGGATEDDCVCHTPDCAIPLDEDEYCYFATVDSGADGIFMNTAANTEALIRAMISVGMVTFPSELHGDTTAVESFYFNRTTVPGASLARGSRFTLYFPDMDGVPFAYDVSLGAIFMQTMSGLVQKAVQSSVQVAAAFQSAKFPVLLGSSIMQRKMLFFDRSRRRLGFADVRPEVCGDPLLDEAEIDVRGRDSVATHGAGCRRGTGSGGGCPQAKKQASVERRGARGMSA